MPRTQEVKIADKLITVSELRVRDLKETISKVLKTDIKLSSSPTVEEVKEALVGGFQGMLQTIAPELTDEDLENAYPSELEQLVEAFINANFTGLKKVLKPLSGLMGVDSIRKLLS